MSNPQYVEFKLLMDRQEVLNFQDGFMPNVQEAEQKKEVCDQNIIRLDKEFYNEYLEQVEQLTEERKQQIISYICWIVIKSKMFENFILLVIILNSGVLAMQDPVSDS